MLQTPGYGREARGRVRHWWPKFGDGAERCHPAEVPRSGMGRPTLPKGQPEAILLRSCFGEDWFLGSDLGSCYLRK